MTTQEVAAVQPAERLPEIYSGSSQFLRFSSASIIIMLNTDYADRFWGEFPAAWGVQMAE